MEGGSRLSDKSHGNCIKNPERSIWNRTAIKKAFDFMCELGENLSQEHLAKLEISLERLLNLQCHYESYLVTLLYLAQQRNQLIEKLSHLLPSDMSVEIRDAGITPSRVVLLSPRGNIFVRSLVSFQSVDTVWSEK